MAREKNFARAFSTAFQPYTQAQGGYHRFPEQAAAGLWSTPSDLLRAIAAIQHSLHHNDGFISKQTARTMLTRVTPNQEAMNMAMGWGADEKFFGHRGESQPGYHAYVLGTHDGTVNSELARSVDQRPDVKRGGFAIMTNSVLGLEPLRKIVAAYFYLNKWPLAQRLPCNFGSMTDFVPFAAPQGSDLSVSWEGWAGNWNGGWTVREDHNFPKLSFRNIATSVRLLPAAIPSSKENGEVEQTLVAEECDIALRLCKSQGTGVLQLIQSDSGQVEILHRDESR